jgi:hypothetical protein
MEHPPHEKDFNQSTPNGEKMPSHPGRIIVPRFNRGIGNSENTD